MQAGDVILRPIEEYDLPFIREFRNDPSVVSVLGGFSTGYSRQDIERWYQAHQNRSDEVLWTIALPEEDRCIGHVGLYQIDYRIGKADFGIVIGNGAHRGRGIGRQVTEAVVRFGFAELGLRKVTLSVLATNSRAIRLYESVGFEREGVLKDDQFRDGAFVDTILMARFSGTLPIEDGKADSP
jgi:RimJ/RimL family protein N-acetyltransferase